MTVGLYRCPTCGVMYAIDSPPPAARTAAIEPGQPNATLAPGVVVCVQPHSYTELQRIVISANAHTSEYSEAGGDVTGWDTTVDVEIEATPNDPQRSAV